MVSFPKFRVNSYSVSVFASAGDAIQLCLLFPGLRRRSRAPRNDDTGSTIHFGEDTRMHYLIRKLLFVFLLSVASIASSITPKDTLVIASKIDDLITLDPAAMFELPALEYAYNSYDRLIGYDINKPTKFYGIIAKDWSISADGLIYTFTIKKDLKFASGNPITVQDVVFSLQRVILLNKAPSSILGQFGFNPENVKTGISVISADSLQLKFKTKFAANLVLNCLTAPVASIVDKQEVLAHQENNDLGNKWLSTNHAGSGLFKLNKWVANEILYLEKNPYFKQPTTINKVIVRHVGESSTQKLLLEQNDIDVAKNLQANNLEKLSRQVKLVATLKSSLICLCLNQNNPYLQHKEVRQAIKYLIDYQGIKDNLFKDRVEVHQSFIPKGFFAANDNNPFSFNLEKAKALLKKAGLENGFTISLDAKNIMLAQAIQSSLSKAGIKVSIIPGNGKQVLTKFRERKYDAIITSWGADYKDPHANAVSFTNNPNNSAEGSEKTLAWRASWAIPELTLLTMQAAKEGDITKRKQLYSILQQQFFDNSPIIVMFQEADISAINNKAAAFKIGLNADSNAHYYGI